jgi:hypothetical protein
MKILGRNFKKERLKDKGTKFSSMGISMAKKKKKKPTT